jgi:hypothetical protein
MKDSVASELCERYSFAVRKFTQNSFELKWVKMVFDVPEGHDNHCGDRS